MAIKIELTCPLKSECETISDGVLKRCAWFTELAGRNPQTGESIDEKACAIAWLPLMQVEVAQTQRASNESVISLREETIKRQDQFLGMAYQARLDNGINR